MQNISRNVVFQFSCLVSVPSLSLLMVQTKKWYTWDWIIPNRIVSCQVNLLSIFFHKKTTLTFGEGFLVRMFHTQPIVYIMNPKCENGSYHPVFQSSVRQCIKNKRKVKLYSCLKDLRKRITELSVRKYSTTS